MVWILPYADEPERGRPFRAAATRAILWLTLAVFALQVAGLWLEGLPRVERLGAFVPARLAGAEVGQPTPVWATLVTYAFLHGGLLHLGSNMLGLWITGDDVERRLGARGFVAAYLAFAVAAALAEAAAEPDFTGPMVGASGAVAGLFGAYLMIRPRAVIRVAIGFLVIWRTVRLPAWLVISSWALAQALALGGTAPEGGATVAYVAHLAGFALGVPLGLWLRGRPPIGRGPWG